MDKLMAFTVVHHRGTHEATTTVVAASKWDASLAVEGKVMHVSEGDELRAGKVLQSLSWNMDSFAPDYREASPSWKQYLVARHFNSGLEEATPQQ